ncbi:CotH kinase family protein [Limnovirga soli]|uniref:CotH protein n=1 Tax=Limnovirga soli TaxID=2656915 RepID=A0A8J8FHZ4_9BACT|nr:CotH kinase family protein [Limnovirga soli]NNV56221.1 hypothetical protein [Limnovirga soli]
MNKQLGKIGVTCMVLLMVLGCSKTKDVTPAAAIKGITSFQFTTAKNKTLYQNITCTIQNDTVYAATFSGTDISALIPDFGSDGIKVTVNNTVQQSGVTAQDFTKLVVYTITAQDGRTKNCYIVFTDTKLPAIYISTNNTPIVSTVDYVAGNISIKAGMPGTEQYQGNLEIRGRGNSTWGMPKQPYKFKLEKKAGLLEMHTSKQWVLLANYADKTLMRNEVAFELSRRLGLAYTTDSRYADVILNGKYIGNYELVEQIDVDDDKVNIAEQDIATTTLPGISGGYLFEMDGFSYAEPVNFLTPLGMGVTVHYPDDEDINDVQRNYITNYVGMFENSLFSAGFDNAATGYKQYFDIDSYINWYLVNEIIANPDTFWSTYMYKDRDNAKIYTGPVWDFDIAANNDIRLGNVVNALMIDVAHEPKVWIRRLMEDPAFRIAIRNRWNAVKTDKVKTITAYVDELAAKLSISQKTNFIAWPILQTNVYLNFQVAGSYEAEVAYLKTFLTNRITWLDFQFNGDRFK